VYSQQLPNAKAQGREAAKKSSIFIAADYQLPTSAMLDTMMQLVDTHAHLCDPVFDPDRERILERARKTGVSAVLSVSENLSDAEMNLHLAARHPMIRAAAGLYPTNLDLDLAAKMCAFIRKHRNELVSIGEVGLDYWIIKDEAQREIQREIFRSFIDLGRELSLPLNVHSRSAGRHTVAFLLESAAAGIQLHAFDGKASAALPAVEAGYFFSIPPSIVRSEQKRKLVRKLPLSCLLVETDSPVLGPVTRERNEPANALIAVKTIAEIKGIAEAEAVEAIHENMLRLYGDSFS
jgi:TatD DNase family protein